MKTEGGGPTARTCSARVGLQDTDITSPLEERANNIKTEIVCENIPHCVWYHKIQSDSSSV